MRDKKVKTKREIVQLFLNIILSIDDMDTFEQREIKKIRPTKSTWHDWLANYIPEPIRKSVGSFKDEIVSLLKRKSLNKLCVGEEKN